MCLSSIVLWQWKKLEFCDAGNEKGCLTSGGRLPNWIENSTVTSFRPALVQHEYTYSQTFNGKPAAMTMLVSMCMCALRASERGCA